MKTTLTATAIAFVLCVAPGLALAGVIFTDDFNGETPGLNLAPSQWTVSGGTVDIIGVGTVFDFLPGNGYYIDLDGSTGDAGRITTATPLSLAAGITHNLSFTLAGSQRGDINTVTFGVDYNSDSILDVIGTLTLPSGQGFTTFNLAFTPGSSTTNARIVFEGSGGDYVGLLLDNVSLSTVTPNAVPEPRSTALLSLAFAGMWLTRRRNETDSRFQAATLN